jgi:hypothetical protein
MPLHHYQISLSCLEPPAHGFKQSDDIKNSPKRAKLKVKVGRG